MSEPVSGRQAEILWDMARALGGFRPTGIAESGHGVVFGFAKRLGEIAVKPHGKYERADMERRRMLAVAALGIPTLEPLEVAAGNHASYLVTRQNPDLTDMSQHAWAASIGNRRTRRELIPALMQGGQDMARFHSVGVAHGDAHVGNMARDEAGQVALDLERVSINEPPDKLAPKVTTDLHKLGASVLVRGFLAERSSGYRAGALGEHLLAPYMELVDNPALPPIDVEAVQHGWQVTANTGRISPHS